MHTTAKTSDAVHSNITTVSSFDNVVQWQLMSIYPRHLIKTSLDGKIQGAYKLSEDFVTP